MIPRPDDDCHCPIHASHGGCRFAQRFSETACNCHALLITQEARNRYYSPPQQDYFMRTFGHKIEEAKKYNRRAFR